MTKIFKIYKIEFPSGKVYIGQTCNLYNRWREHLLCAKTGVDIKVYRAMRKYKITIENFSVLENNILTKEEANAKEIYYISKFDSFKNGYNSTPGGDGFQLYGENHPEAKLSDSQILEIRQLKSQMKYSLNEIYEFYKLDMSYSGFQKIWNYETREEVGADLNTEEVKKYYKHKAKTLGESHGNSKLSDDQVLEIRKRYYENGEKIVDIFEDFKDLYSLSGFRKIIKGETYKNVPIPNKTSKCKERKKKLSKKQVLFIRKKYNEGYKIMEIIKNWFPDYKEPSIYLIATKQRYKNY